jgi:hypothetical protein
LVRYRLVGKCKICKINKIDNPLFEKIHELRFKDNLTLEQLQDYVNLHLQNNPVNLMNLSTHFTKHIPVDLKAQYAMKVKEHIPLKIKEEKLVPESLKNKANKMVKDKVDLYRGLEDLYVTLKERFEAFDKINFVVEGNERKLMPLSLDGYSMFTKELRSCLSELNKMKQSEQLLKFLVETVMKEYTMGTLQGIHKELEELKNVLRFYIKDPNVVANTLDSIKENIGGHLSLSSKAALNAVKEYLN